MSSQQRKGARASTAKKKPPEVHDLKGAYILKQEAGDAMIESLSELPIKHSQVVGPLLNMLQTTFRGDITVTIDPNKPAPTPALGPTGVKPPGGVKPSIPHPASKKPSRKTSEK
jgi:hypothetical protein